MMYVVEAIEIFLVGMIAGTLALWFWLRRK
jgi:hypothetical protein